MKTHLLQILLGILLLTSCTTNSIGYDDPSDVFTVSVSKINTDSEGTSVMVEVFSKFSYDIYYLPDWISTTANSYGKGITKFELTIAENTTANKRSATIRVGNIHFSDLIHKIYVSQEAGAAYISPSYDKLECSAEAFTEEVSIESNIEYTICSSQEW